MTVQAQSLAICDLNGRKNIQFEDALTLAKSYAPRRPKAEKISLYAGNGRILSEPLFAEHSVPPFANAAMDGYALARRDLEKATSGLPLGPRILAGSAPRELLLGTASPITTGAPMPLGADVVIEQERCSVHNKRVFLNVPPSDKSHIRVAGEDIQAAAQLAPAGTIVTPRLAALAASTGVGEINVQTPLRVALISTGNELVAAGEPLEPGKIHESVRMFLSMELQRPNLQLVDFGMQPDNALSVAETLKNAVASADLVLTTGGASVGSADPIRAALQQIGAMELFHGVKMRPGKPLGLHSLNDVPIVTLPGNPFAAVVGYHFVVRAMIETSLGARIFGSREIEAKLSADFTRRREVLEFVPVMLDRNSVGSIPVANVIGRGSSARLSPLAAADGIAVIGGHGTALPAGTTVPVSQLGPIPV